nr:hypothetical protein 209 - Synechococcus sp [Synechococcus sp.]
MSLETISLEQAVGLLSLPRTLGEHPETGRRIQAGLGRFGPYVVCDLGGGEKDYRSLKADDDVLTIDLDRALELLAQPKKSRGRGKEPIREVGLHPDDQAPIQIFEGPYGLYLKHGKVNASLPEDEKPETISLETAVAALAPKPVRPRLKEAAVVREHQSPVKRKPEQPKRLRKPRLVGLRAANTVRHLSGYRLRPAIDAGLPDDCAPSL